MLMTHRQETHLGNLTEFPVVQHVACIGFSWKFLYKKFFSQLYIAVYCAFCNLAKCEKCCVIVAHWKVKIHRRKIH